MSDVDLLTVDTVADYLRQRGLLDSARPTCRRLGGGVSNVVLAVDSGTATVVVKQSLPRLAVAEEWLAPTERVIAEAVALEFAGGLTPERVPRVLDRDPERHTITVQHAPPGWTDWKSALLSGVVDPQIASDLGEVLGRWHAATVGGVGLDPMLCGTESFDALRVDPYHRTVARRAPEYAAPIEALIGQMSARRNCLVHGDFSPKNVLVGPSGHVWCIDFEVAHLGAPEFDLAFMLTHLLMKSIHRPQDADRLAECMRRFGAAYENATPAGPDVPFPTVAAQTGALLMARVLGKSPAEYLDAAGRDRTWALGTRLLTTPVDTVEDLPDRLAEARR